MALNMHLTFDGNCREAFDLYRSVFGGEFGDLQTYADGPPDMPPVDGVETLVMHVSLPMGSSMLMGADRNPGSSPTLAVGNNFSVAVEAQSRKHCDEVFAQLSAGGKVTMPLQDMFWGAYFGSCTDRFGINWMINYHLPAS
ncbi:MAG: VOC family protein [Gammaproteobacteria bacterium]|nr:VOC family protein [Gammaproteobacteria bacterium]